MATVKELISPMAVTRAIARTSLGNWTIVAFVFSDEHLRAVHEIKDIQTAEIENLRPYLPQEEYQKISGQIYQMVKPEILDELRHWASEYGVILNFYEIIW